MCIRDRILIDLCPEFASKNSEIVDLIAVSRELSIACYDEQDWDKAYEITEQWLPKYPHHTDLLSAKIWISLQRGSQSLKELLILIEEELKFCPNNDSLLFCKAEILRKLREEKRALETYSFLFENSKNGMICKYIQENISSMQGRSLLVTEESEDNSSESEQAEDIQKVILQLLREIKQVCLQEKIPFFLQGILAAESYLLNDFASGCCSTSLILHPADRKRFIHAMQKNLKKDRSLECFETNPNYPEFNIRYGNTNTLMLHVKEESFYQHHNVCIKIYFVRENEKNKWVRKFHNSIVAAMESTAYPSVFCNPTNKKVIAGIIIKCMMTLLGKRNTKNILWKWVYHPKNLSTKIHGSVKGYWLPITPLPEIDFSQRESIILAGEEFYIPKDTPSYFSKKIMEAISCGKKIGIQPKLPYIMKTTISEYEYCESIKKKYSVRKYAYNDRKTTRIYKKNAKYRAAAIQGWNIVKRSYFRFLFAKQYAPLKEKILSAYHTGDFETLNFLLKDYLVVFKENLNHGLVLIFDTEIFRITWALLEQENEYELIKKMMRRIPLRHLENLQIEKLMCNHTDI